MSFLERGTYEGDTIKLISAGGEEIHVRHGYGTYTYESAGFEYTGEWENGVKQGKGILTLKDVFQYDGQFINDEMTGHGTKVWYANNLHSNGEYVGSFINGEYEGAGEWWQSYDKYEEEEEEIRDNNEQKIERYIGEFHANKRHGNGTLFFINGDTYTGTFQQHQFHGVGQYTWKNGSVYNGEFVCHMRHGMCEEHHPSGAHYVGEYRRNERAGHGVYTYSSIVMDGEWKHGIPLG